MLLRSQCAERAGRVHFDQLTQQLRRIGIAARYVAQNPGQRYKLRD